MNPNQELSNAWQNETRWNGIVRPYRADGSKDFIRAEFIADG